jgi:hypothetical protein
VGVVDHEVTRDGPVNQDAMYVIHSISTHIGYARLPVALVHYLVAVSLLGPAAAIGWMIAGPDSNRPHRWLLLAVLTMLACVAERFPLHLTHKTYVNVATAVYVAMLLAVPLPLCGIAAMVAVSIAQGARYLSNPALGLPEPIFNVGQTALYVTAAAACVSALEQMIIPPVSIGDIPVPSLVAASVALHLGNSALVAGASARHLAVPIVRMWKQNVLLDIGPHAGMTLVGACAAQLGYASPALVPALVVPAILVHRTVQISVQLRESVREALVSLVEIVELRDPYTAGHSHRVAHLARRIALEMGLTAEEADNIEDAGQVHDLGKVAIDPAILLNPGKLSDSEWADMKRHPVYGAEVLQRFESYNVGVPLVRGHHEAWDGSGYPDNLAGSDIPFGARILAVADTFDALTSDRPYRAGMSLERAREILRDGADRQWDPEVVQALFRLLDADQTITAFDAEKQSGRASQLAAGLQPASAA